SPLTEAGAAVPAHQTGSLEASTPALSRTTPSVTSAATLRFIMRIVRMSPKIPADVTPIASATAMQPPGISSMAPRVETGFALLSGVAKSSRTGTKPQRERGTHEASAGNERLRPAHPAAPDAFLQQHGGDGRGGDRAQRVVKGRTHEHTSLAHLFRETSLSRSQTARSSSPSCASAGRYSPLARFPGWYASLRASVASSQPSQERVS